MDRHDLQDNGRLDLHQHFTEYTSRHSSSYSVKIIKKMFITFLSKNLQINERVLKIPKFLLDVVLNMLNHTSLEFLRNI